MVVTHSQTTSAVPVEPPEYIEPDGFAGLRLAWRRIEPRVKDRPGIVWLGGFKSDMLSTKAERISDWARPNGRGFLRFDYSGHGESGGDFRDGTITAWSRQSLAVIRQLTEGPQILVGSSMGGWIALLVARALAELGEAARLGGMVLIAPAVDFTQELMWERMPEDAKRDIETKGFWLRPTQYAPEPYPVTRTLIQDGRNNLLFGDTIRSYCPVHILQGMQDPDVPWQHALKLVEHLAGDPVTLSLVRDGDHRLSREEDIQRLLDAISNIC